MSDQEPLVLYESSDRIARITINRPQRLNALSNALVAELRDAFIRYRDSDDRCAILTASGNRAFSVGATSPIRRSIPTCGSACPVSVSCSTSR